MKLVDDSDLDHVHPPRHQTIGASSEPYGHARVEVRNATTGGLANVAETSTANHVLVTGLLLDTEYTYKITVNGQEWAAGERRDWVAGNDARGLVKSSRSYDNRFRTHPHPEISAPLSFAVLGDYGTGVRKPSNSKRRQREVAAALERAVNAHHVRLILTTGDNIYANTFLGIPLDETGDEDDDWFFTFYQPYRYIINRVPVYPCVGNHDTGETEKSDDRKQLMDNFYLNERFSGEEAAGRASLDPGLFYSFRYGADIEFLCIDTSKSSLLFGDRLFKKEKPLKFLESSLLATDGGEPVGPVWRIPFMHHPPYTAGPRHHNSRSMIETLVPLFKRAGVQVVCSGHEHNFQLSRVDGIHYCITGAGSKVTLDEPSRFDEAQTLAWAAAGHFLLVEVNRTQMTIRPIAELVGDNPLSTLLLRDARHQTVDTPVVIARAGNLPRSQSG